MWSHLDGLHGKLVHCWRLEVVNEAGHIRGIDVAVARTGGWGRGEGGVAHGVVPCVADVLQGSRVSINRESGTRMKGKYKKGHWIND